MERMFGSLVTGVDEALAEAGGLVDAELGDAVVALHEQRVRLEALEAAVVARFDTAGAWADDGARSATAWLAWRLRVPVRDAHRARRLGRACRSMAVVDEAWRAGRVNAAHVSLLVRAQALNGDAFARDEAMLVEHATTLRFPAFQRAMAYWSQLAAPEAVEDAADAQAAQREVHLSPSIDGMWFGTVTLDPIRGAIVSGELSRLERELFEADWRVAEDRLGRAPCADDLVRTPVQRCADALVEMATRSAAMPADAQRPTPLFTVVVGYETLAGRVCELADRQVVTPGSLVPWLDEAHIERIVFEGPSRVIDVGVTQRLFRGATRRAVQVRDRDCFHPTCDEPSVRCQVDHVVSHSLGGLTTMANGQLACAFHNRSKGAIVGAGARAGPDPP
jgi:hypothetical protein